MRGYECHLFHKVLAAILNICQTCHSLSVKGGMKFHIILDYFLYQLSHKISKAENALVYPEPDIPFFFHQPDSIAVKFHTNLTHQWETVIIECRFTVRNCYNSMRLQKHWYGK